MDQAAAPLPVALPAAPALAAGPRGAAWLSVEGEIEELTHRDAARRAAARPAIVCHRIALARRLRVEPFPALDVLELFAFARPARFCLPTARGVASAVGLAPPGDLIGEALSLREAARRLLAELAADADPDAASIAVGLARSGWTWAPAVLAALGVDEKVTDGPSSGHLGLDVWNQLANWREEAPRPAPSQRRVEADEARAELRRLLHDDAEPRPQQAEYAAAVAAGFAPRDVAGSPIVVLAEAGTGIGKTLGYIAPTSLWARRNKGVVWLSTFTKNLQRQIDQELDRLYPQAEVKAEKVVVRKGRENYLCLLNMEDAAGGRGTRRAGWVPVEGVALGLMARWALASRDGDMVGGDFPAWLVRLLGHGRTLGLTDRRGECIYSACPHYRKCFIERAARKARHADIVIANHALVMITAALGREDASPPLRYVFDEGHHLFDAADGAFSADLSGSEMAELRHWLRGDDRGRRGLLGGIERRLGDLVAADEKAREALRDTARAGAALAAPGWLGRIGAGQAAGPAEAFLDHVRAQVLARNPDSASGYGLEASVEEPVPGLIDAALALEAALARIANPMNALRRWLAHRLDEAADELDTDIRVRIEAARRGLERRERLVATWRAMLGDLRGATPEAFVDWLSVARHGGRDVDVGFHRHWIDPTIPFAEQVLKRAHGAVITSATLRDRGSPVGGEKAGDAPDDDALDDDWASAEVRTGAHHLALPARRVSVPSPFDYPEQTRVIVVTDVRRDDADQVAAAYRALFLAAGGGALGLFTAIARLRRVHERIAAALDDAGLILLAQHVDAIDTGTLVDIFRAEPDSCLLGTDAVRDGVDVPGRSLRLIVFDRVPWPRPDILHRARKAAFGGARYDDLIARLRLKQAYGRLIRRAGDRGVFVMLDAMMPSRLCQAFPGGVVVHRVGLKDAVAMTAATVADTPAGPRDT